MERVLVTGASGFLGSHVVRSLLGKYQVRGTVRSLANTEKTRHLYEWITAGEKLELVQADLLDKKSLDEAANGCDYIIHVASPFFMECPPNEAEERLYKPARDGAVNVLSAAKKAENVKRVVLTSSMAAIMGDHYGPELSKNPEKLWTPSDFKEPYIRSKTLAEKAAWNYVKENNCSFELTTICPSLIVGPPLGSAGSTSHDMQRSFIMREMNRVPDIYFSTIDVRDCAKAHVLAMTEPKAAGERIAVSAQLTSFTSWAKYLAEEFSPLGYNIPMAKLPSSVIWLASWFNSKAALILPRTKKVNIDTSKCQSILGLDEFTNEKKTLVDHAHACIQNKIKGFEVTPQYKERYNVM